MSCLWCKNREQQIDWTSDCKKCWQEIKLTLKLHCGECRDRLKRYAPRRITCDCRCGDCILAPNIAYGLDCKRHASGLCSKCFKLEKKLNHTND